MKNLSKKRLSLLALILVSIIWGSGFIAVEEAIKSNIGTDAIMTIRFLLASIIIGIINLKAIIMSKKQEIIHGSLAGGLIFVAFYVQTIGQASCDISLVALITSSSVVFVPFFMWALSKQKPNNTVFFYAFLTLIGAIILNWKNGNLSFNFGSLLVFLCALVFAMHIAYLGVVCKGDNILSLTFWQLFSAGILSAIVWIINGNIPSQQAFVNGIGSVIYLAIFSTCICYLLQTMGQQHIPPENACIILSMEGVFGTIFSVILAYEAFGFRLLMGGSIIVFAAIAVNIGLGYKNKPKLK